jgi:hypothetical protein
MHKNRKGQTKNRDYAVGAEFELTTVKIVALAVVAADFAPVIGKIHFILPSNLSLNQHVECGLSII